MTDFMPFVNKRPQKITTKDIPHDYLSSPSPFLCADENLENENNSAKLTFLEEGTGKSVTVWRTLLEKGSENILDLENYREKMGGIVVVLLCHGGYFAGGVFDNHKCVTHKTFRRYVTRKGQGQRQGNFDKGSVSGNSAGKQLRRYNENKHKDEVQQLLNNWRDYLTKASCIFLHAPGINRKFYFPEPPQQQHQERHHNHHNQYQKQQPIFSDDERIHSVPMTTTRPTFAEVSRVFHHLSSLEINQISPENLDFAKMKVCLSKEKEKEKEREMCVLGGGEGVRIVMPKPRERKVVRKAEGQDEREEIF